MTIWQARRTVEATLGAAISKTSWALDHGFTVGIHPESVRVNPGSVEWTADMSYWESQSSHVALTGTCAIDLRSVGTLETVHVGPLKFGLLHRTEGGDRYAVLENGRNVAFSCVNMGVYYDKAMGLFGTPSEAQALTDALNRLRAAARGDDQELLEADRLEFQQEAAAWRALAVKPAISEEVRRHRILAEDAVNEKRFETAVEEYEAGLEINSVWPEGHFNAALLCAELGYYSEAVHHMRAYTQLVPEAPDAQQARDQMVIWEAKLARTR
jgi:hypothetical protein